MAEVEIIMYLWVALDVNDQVKELREKAESYARIQGLESSTLTLPFHISLKISFQVPDDRLDDVVSDIRHIFQSLSPFQIKPGGIELKGPIVWIAMQKNAELTEIHQKLDDMLLKKHGVIQHEFDKNYLFHTSIFMINHQEQITKAFTAIKGSYIPEILLAEKFLIGSSVDGTPGTYRVIKKIHIQ